MFISVRREGSYAEKEEKGFKRSVDLAERVTNSRRIS